MQTDPISPEDTVIGQVIEKFTTGDPSLFELIAEDIDFRIDHYNDGADTSWQQATSRTELMSVMVRLGTEIFPQGTKALSLDCVALGGGWHITRFNQKFYYGLEQKEVTSLTYIVSHESDGVLDYFRETVTQVSELS